MSRQTWQETLITAEIDGTALTNSTTPTSIIPAAARYTLPANFFDVGRALRITCKGRLSNLVTTPGTLTLELRLGSVIAFTSGAIQLSATAHTNVSFILDGMFTCRAIGGGTTANLMGTGQLTTEGLGTVANQAPTAVLPVSAPAVGTGFDSTAAQVVDLFATFSIANAANSIQVHQYMLESVN
jgi:hypothetical protein